MPDKESIAIIGIGCQLPGGIQSPQDFWELLANGKEAITDIPKERWDVDAHFNADSRNPLTQHVKRGGFLKNIDSFDASFFGITPREAICMDPQQRLLLEVTWRSIENAAQPIELLRGRSVGVFVGISSADYSSLLWASSEDYLTPDNEPFILPGNTGCIAANRISYCLDLKGPSFTVDTACSSSLVAVHLACESIWRGESQLAFAGGVQALIHPGIQMSFCKAGLLSPEGRCKSFDADANGYVRSEGAGMILLKPLNAAIKDGDPIHALIRGTAINSDGRSQGLAAPSQRSQAACVLKAFNQAGIKPNKTQYVEAHGTGTRQGDPIELRALGSVLGDNRSNEKPCRVGSVKTNLGHGETAAGITGLIKTALCLGKQAIPPSLHFQTPNPAINFGKLGLQVQTKLEKFPYPSEELIAGVSSFGFGGTNAHVVLSEGPERSNPNNILEPYEEPPVYLFCISAKTSNALDILLEEYSRILSNSNKESLNNIIASAHLGRSMFAHKFIAVGFNHQEILDQLNRKNCPAWEGETTSSSQKNSAENSSYEQVKLGAKGNEGIKIFKELAIKIGEGFNIDWKNFHKDFPFNRIQVPEHPFIKQRYWWNSSDKKHTKSSLWLEHLGKLQKQSPNNDQCSKILLEEINLPGKNKHLQATIDPRKILDLADHMIKGWIVFPAAGYLELMLDYKAKVNQISPIYNLKVDSPLKINETSQLIFEALIDEQGSTTFFSQNEQNEDWQRHGELTIQTNNLLPNDLETPVITSPPENAKHIDIQLFYKNLELIGFEYGKHYQTIETLYAHEKESWAEIISPKGDPARCLIDGCFQSIAACISIQEKANQIFLPVAIDEINLPEWPLPSKFECHASIANESDETSTLIANLILSKNGNYLGKIIGVKFRRLNRSLIDLIFPSQEKLTSGTNIYQTIWETITPNNDSLSTNQSEEIILVSYQTETPKSILDWSIEDGIDITKISFNDSIPTGKEPLIIWPNSYNESPQVEVIKFLNLLKNLFESAPRPVLLILEGETPTSSSLRSFQRTVSLERPDWQITTLGIPTPPAEQPNPKNWRDIWAFSETHAELHCGKGILKTPVLTSLEKERFQIKSDGTGRIEGLQKTPLNSITLLPGELEIAVEATGLNFRDILNALGLLTEHATSLGLDPTTSLPYGGEAVGKVIAIGEGVPESLLGKTVVAALSVGSLASHLVSRQELCIPLPQGMSIEEGASFSTAYLTALYGLEVLAKIAPNETVLIHAAAGGVGQAAIQVAKSKGAKVIATASISKQVHLMEQGIEVVFDSRSLDFSDQVLQVTNGEGVDVVLNSLKGPWVDASFRCLKKGGRFLELGKIETWTQEKAKRERPDALYKQFDLLEISANQPQAIQLLLKKITDDLHSGILKNIPHKSWPIERYKDAFKTMAQARHIGKVVVTQPPKDAPISIIPNSTYFITGGLGGIGLQLAEWLSKKGVRSLILASRNTTNIKKGTIKILKSLEDKGMNCILLSCNFPIKKGSEDEVRFNKILKDLPEDLPLRGIFHAAGINYDKLLSGVDNNLIESTMAPKLDGWKFLERTIQNHSTVDFILSFSSIASLLGSPGQSAYAAANGAMEAYCPQKSSRPIHLSIQWGPWKGPGMAFDLENRFESVGIGMLEPDSAFNYLEKLLQRGSGGIVTVVQNDWEKLITQALPRQKHWFKNLLTTSGPSAKEKIWKLLKALPEEKRKAVLLNELRERLAKVMAAEAEDEEFMEPNSIDSGASLFNLGLDSLMAVEFAAVVQAELGLRLDLEALSDDPTLEDLAELGIKQLTPQQGEATTEKLDLAQESTLKNDWLCPPGPAHPSPGSSILLTGSSGFLGAYLLAGQLKRWKNLKVKCLVRAKNKTQGLDRIKTNLSKYELWEESMEERLEAIPGDLALPFFGIDKQEFIGLSNDLGGILHNGAQLSQMASYAQLAATNVGGTKEILKLATYQAPIRVELISSVSVFESEAYRNMEILETDDVSAWEGIHIGYSQTKWVGERLILEAGKKGLPISIYRPPLIGGHSVTGHWHEGDLLQRLLQGCLALGKAPQLAWELDLVPVDYVADSVSALAWNNSTEGKCFHLQHPNPLMLNDLLSKLITDGAPLEQIPMKEWLDAISLNTENPLYPLRAFFKQRWGKEQLTYPELNALGVRARPSCNLTVSELNKLNVKCPEFDTLMSTWAPSLLKSSVTV